MKNVFDLKDNERLCALFCQKELDKAQRQRPYDIKDEINAELQFLARLFRKSGFVSFLFGILLVFMSTFVATAHGALWLQITLCAVGILFLGVSLFITVYTLVRQNRFFKSERRFFLHRGKTNGNKKKNTVSEKESLLFK